MLQIKSMCTSCEVTLKWMPQKTIGDKSALPDGWWQVIIEPMLTKFFDAIWHH